MGAAALPLMIMSTGLSAYGAIQSGQAQAGNARYQSQVALNNQKFADYNAELATQRGQQMEQAKRTETQDVIGAVRAASGASGVSANSGSPLRVQGDVAKLGDIDAMMIRANAAREAYGYRVQGANYGSEAGLLQSEAGQASRAGNLEAFTSLIGGASTVADKWKTWKAS